MSHQKSRLFTEQKDTQIGFTCNKSTFAGKYYCKEVNEQDNSKSRDDRGRPAMSQADLWHRVGLAAHVTVLCLQRKLSSSSKEPQSGCDWITCQPKPSPPYPREPGITLWPEVLDFMSSIKALPALYCDVVTLDSTLKMSTLAESHYMLGLSATLWQQVPQVNYVLCKNVLIHFKSVAF